MRVLALSLAFGVVAATAAAGEPMLRTAAPSRHHVVVTFAPGDMVPGEIAVANTRSRGANGAFLTAHVRLHEWIAARATTSTGLVRYRTSGTVAAGTYFVAVSGLMRDPPADCLPIKSRCGVRWSNVLRVVVH